MTSELFNEYRNKSSVCVAGRTCSSFYVPAYHSARSNFIRQNSWFVRLWVHHQLYPNMKCVLLTFTHRDETVLGYNVRTRKLQRGYFSKGKPQYDPDVIPLFCRDDQQKFFKKLRKSLPGVSIKYLWCSEFGKRFTKRPHYHCSMFFDGTDLETFMASVRRCWSYSKRVDGGKGIKKYIQISLGNVDIAVSPANSPYIENAEGFRYVSKYITKDNYLKEDERFQQLDDKTKEFLRPFMPFKASSTNLGIAWWRIYSHSALFKGIPVPVLNRKKGMRETKYYPLTSTQVHKFFFRDKYSISTGRKTVIFDDFQAGLFLEQHREDIDPHYFDKIIRQLNHVLEYDFSFVYNDYIIIITSIERYKDARKMYEKRVHSSYLRPAYCKLYFDYLCNSIENTAVKACQYSSFSKSYISFLLTYSKVRTLVLPYALQSLPNMDEMQDILYNMLALNTVWHNPTYGFDAVRPMLDNAYTTLNNSSVFVNIERDLQILYKEMLNRSESLIESFREKEDNAKFARESHRGY